MVRAFFSAIKPPLNGPDNVVTAHPSSFLAFDTIILYILLGKKKGMEGHVKQLDLMALVLDRTLVRSGEHHAPAAIHTLQLLGLSSIVPVE